MEKAWMRQRIEAGKNAIERAMATIVKIQEHIEMLKDPKIANEKIFTNKEVAKIYEMWLTDAFEFFWTNKALNAAEEEMLHELNVASDRQRMINEIRNTLLEMEANNYGKNNG